MTNQDKQELQSEIDHIFESGANEIRIFNMVVDFIEKRKPFWLGEKNLNDGEIKESKPKILRVRAEVRYWEDAYVNREPDTLKGENIPCKKGGFWCPEIEIGTGKILNWKKGVEADIHYKVCDCLGYEILDGNGDVILLAEDVYVPYTLSPKENGYGDYIIMDVNSDGVIDKWKFNIEDFKK